MMAKATTTVTTQEREINSRQPDLRSWKTVLAFSRTIVGRSRFQTIIPAIKKEIASTKSAQPEPNAVTKIPPKRAPAT